MLSIVRKWMPQAFACWQSIINCYVPLPTFRGHDTNARDECTLLGLSGRWRDGTDAQWKDFVCYKLHPEENRIISYAESNHQISSSSQHFQMISRAILLLRLATGATRENFDGVAEIDREKLSFWWVPIGEERGIWDTGNAPNDFKDLWQDIQESLDQIDSWEAAGGRSKKNLFNDAAVGVKSLSSCERIGLWGLGL